MIDVDGEQLGVMGVSEAREAAENRDLDLIEVAPNSTPPVCRIMDYGKFRYEQRKKVKEAQKKSKQTEMKMLRVRPNTDDHDIGFKMRNARKFLEKGNKVKFTVIFRGPELRHKEIGQQQLQLFVEGCADVAQVDQAARMEGRRMTMILEPRPGLQQKRNDAAAADVTADAAADVTADVTEDATADVTDVTDVAVASEDA